MLSDETATQNFYKTLTWLNGFLKSKKNIENKKSRDGLNLLWSVVKNLNSEKNKLVALQKDLLLKK